jgi:5-methylcytosine-specific restriction endonuclease McrA
MNRWGIPKLLEEEIKARDRYCVYCGVKLLEVVSPGSSRKDKATWEHIINDASIITRDNIARCCAACNSSKGTKTISNWINSNYCKEKGINNDTVALVVKKALRCV